MIDGRGISCEIVQRWMSMDLTGDELTLVQVMAWCRQAASHYLNQCWLSYMTPYGATNELNSYDAYLQTPSNIFSLKNGWFCQIFTRTLFLSLVCKKCNWKLKMLSKLSLNWFLLKSNTTTSMKRAVFQPNVTFITSSVQITGPTPPTPANSLLWHNHLLSRCSACGSNLIMQVSQIVATWPATMAFD